MTAPLPNDHDRPPETSQLAEAVTRTLTRYSGLNPGIRDLVGAMTGDDVSGLCGTVGWVDEDGNALAAVVHHASPGGRMELSIANDGCTLSRDVLLSLYQVAFVFGLASEILVRVRVADLGYREVLRRVGFVLAGREHRPNGERLLMVLRPCAVPPPLARAIVRRRH